jgi:hypothetical protein
MTDDELEIILKAIKEVSIHAKHWLKDYQYVVEKNEFFHKSGENDLTKKIAGWFEIQ